MSAPEWISGLVRELNHPRPAFAVFFTSAVCLAVASFSAPWIGVAWLAEARPWLVLGLLLSGGLLVYDLSKAIVARFRVRAIQREAINELSELTPPEKAQLALWLEHGVRAGLLDSDGTGEGLVARGILERGEKSDRYKGMRVYRIPSFVWEHLGDHPELVKPKA